jgi:hypothetical protein
LFCFFFVLELSVRFGAYEKKISAFRDWEWVVDLVPWQRLEGCEQQSNDKALIGDSGNTVYSAVFFFSDDCKKDSGPTGHDSEELLFLSGVNCRS